MVSSKSVKVEERALAAFKEAVFAKHGRLYGVLLDEASTALRERAARIRKVR